MRALGDILALRLRYFTRGHCDLFFKDGFNRGLEYVAHHLFDCSVDGRLVRQRTQSELQIVHWWYDVSTLQTGLMVQLHIRLGNFRSNVFHRHTSGSEDQCETRQRYLVLKFYKCRR